MLGDAAGSDGKLSIPCSAAGCAELGRMRALALGREVVLAIAPSAGFRIGCGFRSNARHDVLTGGGMYRRTQGKDRRRGRRTCVESNSSTSEVVEKRESEKRERERESVRAPSEKNEE